MINTFYHLAYPGDLHDNARPTYGRTGWASRYALLRWGKSVHVKAIKCPRDPGHATGGRRIGDLEVILYSSRVGDFMWTWHSECLVTDRVAELFRNAGFTGYELRPVTVTSPRTRKASAPPPRLWELAVTGRAMAHPDSGVKIIETCEACGRIRYSSYKNGMIVDEDQWDGSDFFTVPGFGRHILVTLRVADLIAEQQLTNCILVPSHEVRWGDKVPRPEDLLEKDRAFAQKPLHELLALLESYDPSAWLSAASAIADRLEWGAVEHLIKGFGYPDPVIAESAVLAAGRMAGHAETPEEGRRTILERLRQLLRSEDPEERRFALKALGTSQLASVRPDVRQGLSDPDPEVRRTALFYLGFMQDVEARPLVEERLRDPNPAVRAEARRVLADPEFRGT